jgi:hypothetical protein
VAFQRVQVRHGAGGEADVDDVVLLLGVDLRVGAVAEPADVVAAADHALAVQEPGGQLEVRAWRAHGHRDRRGDAARVQADLQRLLGGEVVGAGVPLAVGDRDDPCPGLAARPGHPTPPPAGRHRAARDSCSASAGRSRNGLRLTQVARSIRCSALATAGSFLATRTLASWPCPTPLNQPGDRAGQCRSATDLGPPHSGEYRPRQGLPGWRRPGTCSTCGVAWIPRGVDRANLQWGRYETRSPLPLPRPVLAEAGSSCWRHAASGPPNFGPSIPPCGVLSAFVARAAHRRVDGHRPDRPRRVRLVGRSVPIRAWIRIG